MPQIGGLIAPLSCIRLGFFSLGECLLTRQFHLQHAPWFFTGHWAKAKFARCQGDGTVVTSRRRGWIVGAFFFFWCTFCHGWCFVLLSSFPRLCKGEVDGVYHSDGHMELESGAVFPVLLARIVAASSKTCETRVSARCLWPLAWLARLCQCLDRAPDSQTCLFKLTHAPERVLASFFVTACPPSRAFLRGRE